MEGLERPSDRSAPAPSTSPPAAQRPARTARVSQRGLEREVAHSVAAQRDLPCVNDPSLFYHGQACRLSSLLVNELSDLVALEVHPKDALLLESTSSFQIAQYGKPSLAVRAPQTTPLSGIDIVLKSGGRSTE